MDNLEQFVSWMTKVQKEFSENYDKWDGFMDISSEGVQLDENLFMSIVETYDLSVVVVSRGEFADKYPFEAYAFLDGVKFYTIGTEEEFVNVGILNGVES